MGWGLVLVNGSVLKWVGEPKTGPGWAQMPQWPKAKGLGHLEVSIPNQSLIWGFSRNLLNNETPNRTTICGVAGPRRRQTRELRWSQSMRWVCEALSLSRRLDKAAPLLPAAPHEDLVLSQEPASDRALQSLWMCLTTAFWSPSHNQCES